MTEITQADRDAAERLIETVSMTRNSLAEAFARHRMEERAAVVAWCRNVNIDWCGCADAIEAGDHLK